MEFPFLCSFFFIFPLILHKFAEAGTPEYEECKKPFLCGTTNVNLSYPFFDGQTRPSYCGYPGFQIDCSRDLPQMSMLSNTYYLLSMDTDTVTIASQNYYSYDGFCPQNLNINSSLYKFSSTNNDITIFYGCSTNTITVNQFLCKNMSNSNSQMAYYTTPSSGSSQAENLNDTCTSSVVFPIQHQSLAAQSSNIIGALTGAFHNGFGLEWIAENDLCDGCQHSGGKCGYKAAMNKFACYCTDGTYDSDCNGNNGKKKYIIIATSVILGTCSIAILTLLLLLWLARRREKQARRKRILETMNYNGRGDQKTKFEELPFFEFEILEDATQNFSLSHKLGQGGFGQVYKGKLKDGQEVAVKRLSAASGQGLEEFRNEVIVISRLQHMNLVKLIGFCVEGEEKLLVYEYMPNKSLSAFLFDPIKRELLDWGKRLNIIEGVCRGLIYLHRDSRLRIIHRDLKTSNILLDNQLNPKISDFGMARIFRHGQDEDETRRVVGTYGYMAPEYAMEGHFSEKSDVYSFGVLLLEIVSGKRNTKFLSDEESLTLLGYVWKLWIEDQADSLIDPIISDPKHNEEIIRSIQVGLLCVQESVNARPTTSTVISMLSSDIANLPRPKQPGFNRRQIFANDESSQPQSSGGNNVSITALSAR